MQKKIKKKNLNLKVYKKKKEYNIKRINSKIQKKCHYFTNSKMKDKRGKKK